MSFFQTINGFDLLLAIIIVGLAFRIKMELDDYNNIISDYNNFVTEYRIAYEKLNYILDWIGSEEEKKLYIGLSTKDYLNLSRTERRLLDTLQIRHKVWYEIMLNETDDLEFVNFHKAECFICNDLPF